jgi:hypothetical protein
MQKYLSGLDLSREIFKQSSGGHLQTGEAEMAEPPPADSGSGSFKRESARTLGTLLAKTFSLFEF